MDHYVHNVLIRSNMVLICLTLEHPVSTNPSLPCIFRGQSIGVHSFRLLFIFDSIVTFVTRVQLVDLVFIP